MKKLAIIDGKTDNLSAEIHGQMRKFIFIAVLLANVLFLSAKDITVTVDMAGFTPNIGTITVSVQSEENEENKVKEPFFVDTFPTTTTDIEYTLQLPEGTYMFSIFQDVNNNGELDTNFFGIPKEPVGMSNYNFKGIPGGFNKHKVAISAQNNHVDIMIGGI